MTRPNPDSSRDDPVPAARYSRQVLFGPIGEAGQARMRAARVTLIGCGALGTALADILVRAGVGFLRIIDRDFVELNNLQRQTLFDETDATEGIPKAIAAAERLSRVNSDVIVEPVVADAHAGNIEAFIQGANLILDGTDNFETRYLINDAAVKHAIPWIYGACVAAEGMVMPILPRVTPCLRCVFDRPPPPGTGQTCDTAGILGPVVQIVAALQAIEALKVLTDHLDDLIRRLVQINVWSGEFQTFEMQRAYDDGECPCCKHAVFDYLDGRETGQSVSLCGRGAVQVRPPSDRIVDLNAIAEKVSAVAKTPPKVNRYLLRFEVERYRFTLFRDGRAIIQGASEPDEGRSAYARYIGT